MNREEVFEIINKEREYQEGTFVASEMLPSGLTRSQRDSELCSHLIMLKSYIDDAIDGWTWDYKRGTDEVTVCQNIAKLAAIAVRALERVPFAEELKTRGLRENKTAAPISRELVS